MSWRTILLLVLGGFIGGVATLLLLSSSGEIKLSDVISLMLGIAALVLALVAKDDAARILTKIDGLTSSMDRQEAHMGFLAHDIQARVAEGGGTVPIQPGVTRVGPPPRKRS